MGPRPQGREASISAHTGPFLFEKWANSAHTKIRLYEESNPSHDMNHRTESLSYYHAFTARRYNKIN